MCFSINAHSKTIWCKSFGVGCPDVEKETLRCKNLSNSSYREFLEEAFLDPSKWQLSGYDNAQDYANKRARSLYSMCIKDM